MKVSAQKSLTRISREHFISVLVPFIMVVLLTFDPKQAKDSIAFYELLILLFILILSVTISLKYFVFNKANAISIDDKIITLITPDGDKLIGEVAKLQKIYKSDHPKWSWHLEFSDIKFSIPKNIFTKADEIEINNIILQLASTNAIPLIDGL
jgi:hypothetical protein